MTINNRFIYSRKREETEQEWEVFLETLPAGEQEKAEEMKERLEDFASAQEKRAYIQGYVDCVQALYHIGILKKNKKLKIPWKQNVYGYLRVKSSYA